MLIACDCVLSYCVHGDIRILEITLFIVNIVCDSILDFCEEQNVTDIKVEPQTTLAYSRCGLTKDIMYALSVIARVHNKQSLLCTLGHSYTATIFSHAEVNF